MTWNTCYKSQNNDCGKEKISFFDIFITLSDKFLLFENANSEAIEKLYSNSEILHRWVNKICKKKESDINIYK